MYDFIKMENKKNYSIFAHSCNWYLLNTYCMLELDKQLQTGHIHIPALLEPIILFRARKKKTDSGSLLSSYG